jgi:hypothetical protein
LKQREVDEIKKGCLEDIRETQWELADDMRDVIRIQAQMFADYHESSRDNYI